VVTPDGRKVYVSSDGASTVSVIDTATDRVVASIEVGANPHGLAVSGDGSRVLVSGWGSNRVLVIDTATDRVIGEVPVAHPHNGTLSRDGRTGWVASDEWRDRGSGTAGSDCTSPAWRSHTSCCSRAVYVDNGPHLPLWRSLPPLAHWPGRRVEGGSRTPSRPYVPVTVNA
jgi:YVTN family beta-propeller protein